MVSGSIYVRLERPKSTTDISMTSLPDDVTLMKRIAAREDAALRELYVLYGQRMMAYAQRLTQDRAMAEDVVQDVLVVVWRSAGRFRGEGRVIAWLLGIVHHTAMKALRHPHQPISEEMAETLAAAEPSPEEQVEAGERAAWVRRGLQSLTPDHRAALELVFYQGMSLAEAADVCGCPVGTIKSRLSYARRYLRGVLSYTPQVEDRR
jgi:RNA polymerase sigma-70 factor (ECF subfamily)